MDKNGKDLLQHTPNITDAVFCRSSDTLFVSGCTKIALMRRAAYKHENIPFPTSAACDGTEPDVTSILRRFSECSWAVPTAAVSATVKEGDSVMCCLFTAAAILGNAR